MNQLEQLLETDKTITPLSKAPGDQDGEGHRSSLSFTAPNDAATIDQENSWQARLLPFMLGTIFVFSAFFFIATASQMWSLYDHMIPTPGSTQNHELARGEQQFLSATPQNVQLLEYFRWKASYLLEQQIIQERYRQANLTLLSRLWIKYAGFVTGMILAIVGSVFIVGKLHEPQSTLAGNSSGWGLSFKTASPGLVLCVLGTSLMIVTHVVHQAIETYDVAVYANSGPLTRTPEFEWNTQDQGMQKQADIHDDIRAFLTDKELEPRHAQAIQKALKKAEGARTIQNSLVQ